MFFNPNNDHVCTRLEHVLLVSSISRTIARALNLNEDLAEAISLGHDLGHAPFGHHGEQVLSEICHKKNIFGGVFKHEIHSLRVVDSLAHRDRESDPNLNLTFEVRDGIVSHNGEVQLKDTNYELKRTNKEIGDLDLIKTISDVKPPYTLEGCVVRIADRIAYSGRDLEDGLMAKLIVEDDIPKEIKKSLGQNNSDIVGKLVESVIKASDKKDFVGIEPSLGRLMDELIEFNSEKIYNNPKNNKYKAHAERVINELFDQLLEEFDNLEKQDNGIDPINPNVIQTLREFKNTTNYRKDTPKEEIIIDFIAGMTDNYVRRAVEELLIPKAIT